jgi:hypothetical protein
VLHSTIEPSDVDVIECPDQEYIKVEAKPKSSKECRLIDAEFTLDSLENVEDRMEVLPAPDGDGEYARWFERIDAPSIAVNKTPDRNQHKDEEDEEDC